MVVRAHGSERCQRFLRGAVRLNKAGVERVQQTAAAVAMPLPFLGPHLLPLPVLAASATTMEAGDKDGAGSLLGRKVKVMLPGDRSLLK